MNKKTNICASTCCRVLLCLFISILMISSLLAFPIGQLRVQAQEPTCTQPDRVWWTAAHPPTRGGRILWSAVNLTRPDLSVIDFPATQPEMDAWTTWQISDTLPIHRDSCRNYLPIIMKNSIGVPCVDSAVPVLALRLDQFP